MKKTLSITAMLMTLFVASCKKDNNGPGNDQPVSRKLAATNINNDITITYNADGTPARITTVTAAGTYKKDFSYAGSKVSYYSDFNGLKDEVGEYTLVNGRVSSFVWTYYDAFEMPIKTNTETYTYNAKGLVQKHVYGDGGYRTFSYDANDNMVENISYNAQAQAQSKAEYTYTGTKDLFPSFGYFDSYGNGFFLPSFSKHLPQTLKVTDLQTNAVTYQGSFTYDLDNNGYMIQGHWHKIAGPGSDFNWTNSFQ